MDTSVWSHRRAMAGWRIVRDIFLLGGGAWIITVISPSGANAQGAAPQISADVSQGKVPEKRDVRVNLRVGDGREISFAPQGEDARGLSGIRLSRKGIVIPTELGDGRWKLIGHRPGFVVAESRGDPTARFLVTVRTRGRSASPSSVPSGQTFKVRAQEYDTLAAFKAGLEECRGTSCIFAGKLAPSAMYELVETTRRALSPRPSGSAAGSAAGSAQGGGSLQPLLEFPPSASSPAVIRVVCGLVERKVVAEIVDRLTGGAHELGLIGLDCHDTVARYTYQLHAKIVQVDDSDAKTVGFEAGSDRRAAATLPFPGSRLAEGMAVPVGLPRFARELSSREIRALSRSRDTRVVAQPSLQLVEGLQSEITSGGEFVSLAQSATSGGALARPSGDDHARWKRHGVTLRAKASSLGADRALLEFALALRTPTSDGSASALKLNEITGNAIVAVGTPSVIARVAFSRSGRGEESTPFFSRIPVLGPLFRLFHNESASTDLFLWVLLNRSRPESLEPAKFPPEPEDSR